MHAGLLAEDGTLLFLFMAGHQSFFTQQKSAQRRSSVVRKGYLNPKNFLMVLIHPAPFSSAEFAVVVLTESIAVAV